MTRTKCRRALFPGSFNPFTRGHQSIVDRALALFDEIVIGIGISIDKHGSSEFDRRSEAIKAIYKDNPSVKIVSYDGLTVDAARGNDCQFIVRGVRNAADLDYERSMADINRRLANIETVLLMTLPELTMVSSSVARELSHYGQDISWLLASPPDVPDKN